MTTWRCSECEFSVPTDEIGAAVMQQHLASEHDVTIATVLRACAECGSSILCTLAQDAPRTCREHN